MHYSLHDICSWDVFERVVPESFYLVKMIYRYGLCIECERGGGGGGGGFFRDRLFSVS